MGFEEEREKLREGVRLSWLPVQFSTVLRTVSVLHGGDPLHMDGACQQLHAIWVPAYFI